MKLLELIKNNLFPKDFTCDLCGVETFGNNLCPDCDRTVIKNDGNLCPVCGRRNVDDLPCVECKATLPVFDRAISPLVYSDGTVALIHKFKNGGAYLKEYFADLICKRLDFEGDYDIIVCVPMTQNAIRRRGYNQTELLAQAIARRTGKPFEREAIEKVKGTPEQKNLTRKERVENLKNSFKVVDKSKIAGKRVLIVDDIMTTGATLNEIARILKRTKALKVFAATAASVEYKIV